MAEPTEKPFGHEPDAIHYRAVLICVAILATVVIGVVVGLHLILTRAVIPDHAEIAARPARIPPKPRLQSHPQVDFAQFRARKQALLSGYRWLDAQHDYARIPVERAMQIYAAQHGRSSSAPRPSASTAQPSRGP